MVHDERRRLADDLADIPDEMWQTESLCPGWDVADVVAHIVDTAHMGRLAFVRDMVLARFDFTGQTTSAYDVAAVPGLQTSSPTSVQLPT